MVRVNEKRLIRIIFTIIVFVLVALAIIDSYNSTAYIFLSLYLFLGYITFYISSYWLSSLTMFYVMMTDGLVMGVVFQLKEKTYMFYNPFLIIIFGYVCLLVGYFFAKKIKKSKKKYKRKRYKIGGIRFKVKDALLICFLLSAMMGILYLYTNRSILFTNMEEGRIEAASGNGMILYAIQLQIFIIPCMYIEYKNKKLSGKIFTFCFAISAIELLGLGFRTPLFRTISIILCMMILTRKLKFGKAVTMVVFLVIAILGLGVIRGGTSYSGLYEMFRSHWIPGAYNLNTMFRCFPKLIDFQHGYTYLINIIMLKPGPDLDFTLWLKEAVGMNFSGGGLTPTLFGEFYINFGVVGIYIGMLFLGVLFEYVDYKNFTEKINYWNSFAMMYCSAIFGGGIANVMIIILILFIFYKCLSIVIENNDAFTLESVGESRDES